MLPDPTTSPATTLLRLMLTRQAALLHDARGGEAVGAIDASLQALAERYFSRRPIDTSWNARSTGPKTASSRHA